MKITQHKNSSRYKHCGVAKLYKSYSSNIGSCHCSKVHSALENKLKKVYWQFFHLSNDKSCKLSVGRFLETIRDVASVSKEHLEEDKVLASDGDTNGGKHVECRVELMILVKQR